MSNEKENEGVLSCIVDAPIAVKFTSSGTCTAKLKVKRTETWTGGSKDVFLTFSLFGKPAEALNEKNPPIGTAIRVTYSLGSWQAKNKAGELLGFHNPDLKAWRVDVRTEQPGKAVEDIPF